MRERARIARERVVTLACAFLLAACESSLPPCEPVAAREVVYFDAVSDVTADDGVPMYVGQALFHQSCGGGSYCHSYAAEGELRVGVPKGLDWDVGVPCVDGTCSATDERYGRFVAHVEDLRKRTHRIWSEIDQGRMPPGELGRVVEARVGVFRRVPPGGSLADGTLLPTLDSKEGRDAIGNWLACGAPVVSTTLPSTATLAPGDACDTGSDAIGDCVTRLGASHDAITFTPPLESTWPSLYARVIGPLCGASCHGGTFPTAPGPDLRTQDAAYDSLLHDLTDEGLHYVVPYASPESHLIYHLDGAPTHPQMPPALMSRSLPWPVVDAISAWIDAGAAP